MALEHELTVYKEHLLELLPSEGQFVVIKDKEIEGIHPTLDEALNAGYTNYGPVPFLVKKILRAEPLLYFSRDLPPPPKDQDTWRS